jgi:hypothetical protein
MKGGDDGAAASVSDGRLRQRSGMAPERMSGAEEPVGVASDPFELPRVERNLAAHYPEQTGMIRGCRRSMRGGH